MDNKEKLSVLAMRALEELQLRLEDFNCTLAMILQEKLESPEADIRPILKRAFKSEEPLAWVEQPIPELKIVVINDRCNKQLHFMDTETEDTLLVLKREELRDE